MKFSQINPQGKKGNIQSLEATTFCQKYILLGLSGGSFFSTLIENQALFIKCTKTNVPKEVGNDEIKYYSTFTGSVRMMLSE